MCVQWLSRITGHQHELILEDSLHPPKRSVPVSSPTAHPPHPQPQATPDLLAVSRDALIPDISQKWNHTTCGLGKITFVVILVAVHPY